MVNKIPQIWNVNRNNPTPLFKQLADNIKWSICLGNVGHGWKLPPVRQMSKELGLSVDTIRAAYKSLEEAGLVITRPQHGTEVVKQPDNGQIFQGLCQGEEDSFAAAIRECFAKNLSAEQIRSLFETVLAREQDKYTGGRILFVECNAEDAASFHPQLAEHLDCGIDFLLLDHLENFAATYETGSKRYIAIVTTFFHYSLVLQTLQPLGLPIYGVVTEMSAKSLDALRHYEPGARLGVILKPSHSIQYLVSLLTVVRDDLDIRAATSDEAEAAELVDWAQVFFLTHPCERLVLARRPEAEIHYFCDQINAQSIGILRENLACLLD